MTSLVHCS